MQNSECWKKRRQKVKDGSRGGSRAAATFKMERFVIIVNGFQPLTIIIKRSILDVAAVLDTPMNLTKIISFLPYYFQFGLLLQIIRWKWGYLIHTLNQKTFMILKPNVKVKMKQLLVIVCLNTNLGHSYLIVRSA